MTETIPSGPTQRLVGRQRPFVGARPANGGEVEWHGEGAAVHDYILCGLSVDGDLFVPVIGNHRITWQQCRSIWLASRMIRATDFPPNVELSARGARSLFERIGRTYPKHSVRTFARTLATSLREGLQESSLTG